MPFDSAPHRPSPAAILSVVRSQFASGEWTWSARQEGVCLVAAINRKWAERQPVGLPLGEMEPESYAALRFLAEAIAGDERSGKQRTIIGWNDEPGRTLDDVLAILDEAQKMAETRGRVFL